VHAGTWHPSYDAAALFAAVRELAAEMDGFATNARLLLVGKGSVAVEQAQGYGQVRSIVDTMPLMPLAAVSGIIAGASVLLIARSASGYKSQAITGKIFEYAPYEIPLLSTGGEDDLHATLVRWLGGTWTNDVGTIKQFLHAAFLQWQTKRRSRASRNPEALAYLTQQRMAAETASVLHAVAERRPVRLRAELPWPR
jgi:hypothetical protein